MFEKDIYVRRRAELKRRVGSGALLFLGNDECGSNYADNTYPFRQDSTFLYYFGLPYDGLAAVIDIDNDREIIFGDELTIDHIVGWVLSPHCTRKPILWVSTMCVRRPTSRAISTVAPS